MAVIFHPGTETIINLSEVEVVFEEDITSPADTFDELEEALTSGDYRPGTLITVPHRPSEGDIYAALADVAQAYGFTTEYTHEMIQGVIDSILID